MSSTTVLPPRAPVPPATVVCTTIGAGEFLDDYWAALQHERCADQVEFIVIPDTKTPAKLFERVEMFSNLGMKIRCPDLSTQERYLASIGLSDFVPYNSDNRRNIGYLMALETGRPLLISIDDDNYARPTEAFFEEHAVAASDQPIDAPTINSSNGWFNICRLMQMEPTTAYPRGFPYAKRHQTPEISSRVQSGRVRINAGLWLGEPDLDAMTWLVAPAKSKCISTRSVLLGDRAWSPINTQNTALHKDVIVAYYFAKMNYPLGTLGSIDRYGDIVSGYLAQACVRHMGDRIRVGTPAVDHRRNSHNYLRDATHEMGCVWLMEDLTAWLTELKLTGSNYHETYLSLAAALDDAAEKFNGFIWNESARGYLHQLAYCMRRWSAACRRWL